MDEEQKHLGRQQPWRGRFQFSLRTLILAVLAVAVLMGGVFYLLRQLETGRARGLSGICNIHAHGVAAAIQSYSTGSGSFPYEFGVTGHDMLARVTAAYIRSGCNCPHVAFDSNHGGWQAVNLPPEKWQTLIGRWQAEDENASMPLFWCGKPNRSGLGRLGGFTFNGTPSGIEFLSWDEEELKRLVARLNAHLKAMGEEPVPIDIPDTPAP